jgi:soluble lytic murein transglycosylase-like protein
MQKTSLFLLFIGLCMLALSACDVPNGDGSYTSVDQTSSQQNSQSSSGATDYRSMAYQDAIDAHISPDLYVKQINQESGFNPNAYSSAGAIGIAQIMKATADSWGVNPWEPVSSLNVAAQHMYWYYAHYNNNYAKALAAYNAGTGTVDNAVYYYGSDWEQHMPYETQGYISAIMG